MGVEEVQRLQDDKLAVIGLTSRDIISGAELRLLEMPIKVIEESSRLVEKYGALSRSNQITIRRSWAEVYFLSPFDMIETDTYGDYQTVLFVNETALAACRQYGYSLPTPIGSVTRRDLPNDLGTLLTCPIMHL